VLRYFFDKGALYLCSTSVYVGMIGESPPILSKQSKLCSVQTSSLGFVALSDWIVSSMSWLDAANNDIHDILPASPETAIPCND
jgi:hypothetical protein